jgi:hypothetical protein
MELEHSCSSSEEEEEMVVTTTTATEQEDSISENPTVSVSHSNRNEEEESSSSSSTYYQSVTTTNGKSSSRGNESFYSSKDQDDEDESSATTTTRQTEILIDFEPLKVSVQPSAHGKYWKFVEHGGFHEYEFENHENYLKKEKLELINQNYMQNQPDINALMRTILLDWLIDVNLKFKLEPFTLYLTIALIDRFLLKKSIARTKLQLVGVTCMLIASKVEEIYSPEVRDVVYITDKAYTRDEVLKMERHILSILMFELNLVTVDNFADFYTQKVLDSFEEKPLIQGKNALTLREKYELVRHCILYICEICLIMDFSLVMKCPPSEMCHCAALITSKALCPSFDNSKYFQNEPSPFLSEIMKNVNDMNSATKYIAVRNKYSSLAFREASKIFKM